MATKHRGKKSYRIRIAFSLSNINADFLQLILCMFVSHNILNNPFFGASLFLFANIWLIFFQGNLRKVLEINKKPNLLIWIALAVSLLIGLAVIFFYPIMMKSPQANFVSFFVFMIIARTALTSRVNNTFSKPKASHRWYKGIFQVIFILFCALFAFLVLDNSSAWFLIAGFSVTGLLLSYQSSTLASFGKYIRSRRNDKLDNIASYKVFSNMTLYSQIAFSLAVLMYICYMSFSPDPQSSYVTYLVMALWLVFVLISSELFTRIVNRTGKVVSLNFFIIGAALWTIGTVMMYDSDGFLDSVLWTLFWGFGLACITSVLNSYNLDFKMVARIADRRVSDRDLYFRSLLTQMIAVIFSNIVMLCVLAVWIFVVPTFENAQLPEELRSTMIQLPVLFMLISVIFALRQPLDARNRQKLVNYSAGTSHNKTTKQNLNKRLVEKSRVRFGVKIIAFFVRPFLHLKVYGKENIKDEDFPSIFVCNHGIIYGPVAAVIYLPTYFRPWIDKKMVDRDMAAREMYSRFMYRLPLLSKKAKLWLAKQLARPVTWALNSFNPIPVEKRGLRNIMATFDDTVQVLAEGDNVLIFPEKPRRVKRGNKETVEHQTKTVGSLYTGFANIGKLYYDKTGKMLRFYPIYANKKDHTFRIGEPVVFDPTSDPRAEKQRIAEVLHGKMLALSGGRPL